MMGAWQQISGTSEGGSFTYWQNDATGEISYSAPEARYGNAAQAEASGRIVYAPNSYLYGGEDGTAKQTFYHIASIMGYPTFQVRKGADRANSVGEVGAGWDAYDPALGQWTQAYTLPPEYGDWPNQAAAAFAVIPERIAQYFPDAQRWVVVATKGGPDIMGLAVIAGVATFGFGMAYALAAGAVSAGTSVAAFAAPAVEVDTAALNIGAALTNADIAAMTVAAPSLTAGAVASTFEPLGTAADIAAAGGGLTVPVETAGSIVSGMTGAEAATNASELATLSTAGAGVVSPEVAAAYAASSAAATDASELATLSTAGAGAPVAAAAGTSALSIAKSAAGALQAAKAGAGTIAAALGLGSHPATTLPPGSTIPPGVYPYSQGGSLPAMIQQYWPIAALVGAVLILKG